MAYNQLNKSTLKKLGFGKALSRERPMRKHVPYTRHLTPRVIGLKDGSIAAVIKLNGLYFQTKDQSEINMRTEVQNTIIRNFGSSHFSIWSTIIRKEIKPEIEKKPADHLSQDLDDHYFTNLTQKKLFVNEIYFTVIMGDLRGAVGLSTKIAKAVVKFSDKDVHTIKQQERIDEFEEKIATINRELSAYGSKILTIVENKTNTGCQYLSEPCEFFNKIIMGAVSQPLPLPRQGIDSYVGLGRLYFGPKMVQMSGRNDDEERFGAILSLKEYPSFTEPGFLDELLTTDNELIVTQSFKLEDKPIAQERIARLQRQLARSDAANSELAVDIDYALNALSKHEAVFGYHHLTVLVLAKKPEVLNKIIGDVGTRLTHRNIAYLREDINLEAAFWAQLPGNHEYIARYSMLSSRNFACLSSMHNYPRGINDCQKLHWKCPITVFETTSQTPYYFNFHDGEVGHFTVTGPTGTGKTVVMTFLMSQSSRVTPTPKVIFFDKDRAAEIIIRAMGGVYEVLSPSQSTGFNPFQLENNSVNRTFLSMLFSVILTPANGDRLTQGEKTLIEQAIGEVMKLPKEYRNLGSFNNLLKGSSKAHEEDLSARLKTWISGENSWVFNAHNDVLNISENTAIGFDMTNILNNKAVRIPILMYLFHRLDALLDGSPVVIMLDEAWSLLDNPIFAEYIKNKARTIRKLNGVLGLGTQSASDITANETVRTILEQCKTNIHFPNAKANREAFQEHFKLSEKEFEFILNTDPTSRRFLIKHSLDSVVAKLDLASMPEYIDVLSAKPHTLALCERMRAQYGHNPSEWVPHFLAELRK